jgi:hypothetical protein
MRVAVYLPDGHPEAPGGACVVAYKFGRVEDGVQNYMAHTNTTVPIKEFVSALADRAREEYPSPAEVKIEHFHDNGDGTASWSSDPPAEPVPAGETHEVEITAQSVADARTVL